MKKFTEKEFHFVMPRKRRVSRNENWGLTWASVTAVCPGPVRTAFFKTAEKVHRRAAFKNRFMADPEKVAAKAYRDAMAGRAVSVYGTAIKLLRLMTKLLPMRLLVWMQK
ncbi:hypothetical protein HMP0721_1575 [Pseudoramibacter alactolyticus ATCC 23263]|uniref:Uncharacterized protein n=1 Tax=Pseudoramibacter alactolyticus ATCC 23263 TaxID=887929 RepID=E6MI42_9FIRM|nr:hypothetical protein HMP0721_1575 [Pseudoramibacter alactolyticus ATCC 23263]